MFDFLPENSRYKEEKRIEKNKKMLIKIYVYVVLLFCVGLLLFLLLSLQ